MTLPWVSDGDSCQPMIGNAEIERMTLEDRLKAMELLWDSISRCPDQVPSPSWHGEVIAERLESIEEGKAEFLTVDQLKNRLRQRRK